MEGESLQLASVELSEPDKPAATESVSDNRKLSYMEPDGVMIAESLPLGHCRRVGVGQMKDSHKGVLAIKRRHTQDILNWEEELESVQIVPAMALVDDDSWEFPEPTKGCLKPFRVADILINNYTYQQDPDIADRGRIRFPELCTAIRESTSRAASPPPRPDDPDNTREENRRRQQGLRPMGPPCKPGIPPSHSFQRDLEWERALPDDDVRPYMEEPTKKRTRSGDDTDNKKVKRQMVESRSENRGARSANESLACGE